MPPEEEPLLPCSIQDFSEIEQDGFPHTDMLVFIYPQMPQTVVCKYDKWRKVEKPS